MNTMRTALVLLAAIPLIALPLAASAQEHRMVKAAELKWEPVPSLPTGAVATVIEGPMSEAVPFTIRIKLPANYKIPPHFHPAVERVTVLSGEFHMATGDKFDAKKMMALKAGDMMIMQPKTNHYAWAKTPTVVQLHGTGPWGVTYVNPEDDPRKAAKK